MSDLTVQQEKFCQKYIECKGNASEAYRQSYDCKESSVNTVCTEAYKLLQNPYIAHRVESLQAEHAERHRFTVDKAHSQYVEALEMAKLKEKPEAMISATKAQCELHGIEAPKKVDFEGIVVKIVDMTGKKD